MTWQPRSANRAELEQLAALWHREWHAVHAAFVPPALSALRNIRDFHHRLKSFGDTLIVAGPVGAALGFAVAKNAELDQIYVTGSAKGSGIAGRLLRAAEAMIAANGHDHAHLYCVMENTRAKNFYLRHGWINVGQATALLETSKGKFPLETLRFEKHLTKL